MWWPYTSKRYRPILLGVALLAALGCGLTLTRSVWLGLIIAFVGLMTMIAPKEHRFRVVFAFAIAGGLALGVLGSSLTKFKRDKEVSAEQMAESAKLRPILAAFAYEMFKDNPIKGVGLSQYRTHNIQYLSSRNFDLPMEKAKSYVQPVSYTHLTLPTKRIV